MFRLAGEGRPQGRILTSDGSLSATLRSPCHVRWRLGQLVRSRATYIALYIYGSCGPKARAHVHDHCPVANLVSQL